MNNLMVFLIFALVGIFPFEILESIIITTLVIKFIAALMDTPFLYLMNFIKSRDLEKELV